MNAVASAREDIYWHQQGKISTGNSQGKYPLATAREDIHDISGCSAGSALPSLDTCGGVKSTSKLLQHVNRVHHGFQDLLAHRYFVVVSMTSALAE